MREWSTQEDTVVPSPEELGVHEGRIDELGSVMGALIVEIERYSGRISRSPVVRRVFPGVIANEIVGVQPMQGPAGQIMTLRAIYGA